MSETATPRASAHAELRLIQRAGVEAPTVADVWQEATPVDIEYRHYTTAKYSDALEVVLLECGGVVTTVLRAAYEEFTEGGQ